MPTQSRFLAYFLLAALVLFSPAPARADLFGLPPGALMPGGQGLNLVVYEDGRVLVRDVRSVTVPVTGDKAGDGPGTLVLPGVSANLDPGSLQVRSLTSPGTFRVLETGVRAGLGSSRDLLARYVGRTVRVLLPCPDGAEATDKDACWTEAELLLPGDPPVLRTSEGVYLGPVRAMLLPDGEDLGAGPRLELLVENTGPAEQELEIAYLAQGLAWRADYRLDLDPSGTRGLFSSWATLDNGMDTGFPGARLTLVSGQVNRDYRSEVFMAATMDGAAPKMAPAPDIGQSTVFAYHVYEIGRGVDLGPRETRQLALFEPAGVGVQRELVSRFENFHMTRTPEPVSQGVRVRLTLANEADNGLGLALPAGTVKVFQERKGAPSLLAGEDRIGHTAKGQEIVLHPGNAFDVTVERVLTSFERQGERGALQTWEITCANGGDKPADLVLEDVIPGDWKLVNVDAEYERQGSLLRFAVALEPEGGATITYTVSITY